mmetsp:Transcript_17640/g.29641  ORF Transcript_17640/g.29641 Transcript_17640/m.29641 type:complete len:132 (-) Transcript_17640:9-404(-)
MTRGTSSANPQGTSITSQFSVWYRSLPLVTRYVFTTCVSVQVIAVLVGFDAFGRVCMSPFYFARNFQVYRALTSVVFHGGILHIAFNMLAFVPLGRCAIALSHRLKFFVGKDADEQAHGAFSLEVNVEQLS